MCCKVLVRPDITCPPEQTHKHTNKDGTPMFSGKGGGAGGVGKGGNRGWWWGDQTHIHSNKDGTLMSSGRGGGRYCGKLM